MEAIAVLFGLAIFAWLVCMPAVALVLAWLGRRDTLRLRQRVSELESELWRMEARFSDASAVQAPTTASPAAAAPPIAAPPLAAPPLAAPPLAAPPLAAPTIELPPTPPAVEDGEPAKTPPPRSARAAGRPDRTRPRPSKPRRPLPRLPALSTERVAVWVASAVGGVLVILASLLALKVAVDRGWLIPAARVALGLVAGTGALLGGTALRRKGHKLVSSALSGAGLGVIYGTLWAAYALFHLVGRPPTVVLMLATTGTALYAAVVWRDRFMAHMGLIGGLLTPLMLSSGNNEPVPLFGYLTLLATGAAVAAARRAWPDLLAVAAVGAGGLTLLWIEAWWLPDQVIFGLLGPVVLALPFAGAALWGRLDSGARTAVAAIGAAAAIGLPLLAAPWVLPLDPLFFDPRTGQQVLRDLGSSPWLVAFALPLLALPGWAVALRRDWWPLGFAASMATGALSLAAAAAWADHDSMATWPLALMALGPLVVGLLASRRGVQGLLGAPLPGLAGLAVAGALAAADQPLAGGGLMLSAVAILGVAGALRTGRATWLLSAALGTVLPLLAAAAMADSLGPRAVGGAALVALAVFVPLPALARRFPGQELVPVLAGALAGPAFFWPLYVSWELAFTDQVIGLLPLLLGGLALMTAVLLTRARKVATDDAILALFVAIALLGLSVSLPLQLDRQWLTVAWAIEGAALAALSRRLSHPLVRFGSVALGLIVSARLLLNPWALSYGDAGGMAILNWTLYTWGLPALCLALSARLLRPDRVPAFVPPMLRVLAILLGFALVQVQVSHLFQDAGPLELGGHGLMQGMVHSLAWAAYGIAVLVGGLVAKHRHVRLVGFALVLVAAAKVFTVDLWSLSGFVRVGSVLGLGVTLLLSAFLFERLVLRSDADADDPDADDPDPDPDPDGTNPDDAPAPSPASPSEVL